MLANSIVFANLYVPRLTACVAFLSVLSEHVDASLFFTKTEFLVSRFSRQVAKCFSRQNVLRFVKRKKQEERNCYNFSTSMNVWLDHIDRKVALDVNTSVWLCWSPNLPSYQTIRSTWCFYSKIWWNSCDVHVGIIRRNIFELLKSLPQKGTWSNLKAQ